MQGSVVLIQFLCFIGGDNEYLMAQLRQEVEEDHAGQLDELRDYFEQRVEDNEKQFSDEITSLRRQYEQEVVKLKACIDAGSPAVAMLAESSVQTDSNSKKDYLDGKDTVDQLESLKQEGVIVELRHQIDLYKAQLDSFEDEVEVRHQDELQALQARLELEFSIKLEMANSEHVKEINDLREQLDQLNVETVRALDIQTSCEHLEQERDQLQQRVQQLEEEISIMREEHVAENQAHTNKVLDAMQKKHEDELEKLNAVISEKDSRANELQGEVQGKYGENIKKIKDDLISKHMKDTEVLKSDLGEKHKQQQNVLKESYEEVIQEKKKLFEARIEAELEKQRNELESRISEEIEAAKDQAQVELEAEMEEKWELWKKEYSSKVDAEKILDSEDTERCVADLQEEIEETKEQLENFKMEKEKDINELKKNMENQLKKQADTLKDEHQEEMSSLEDALKQQLVEHDKERTLLQQEEFQRLKDEVQHENAAVTRLEGEIEILEARLSKQRERLKEEHISELQKVSDDLQYQIEVLHASQEEALQKQREQLNKQFDEEQHEVEEKIKDENEERVNTLQASHRELMQQQKDVLNLQYEGEIQELNEKLEDYEDNITSFERKIKQLEDKMMDADNLHAEMEEENAEKIEVLEHQVRTTSPFLNDHVTQGSFLVPQLLNSVNYSYEIGLTL